MYEYLSSLEGRDISISTVAAVCLSLTCHTFAFLAGSLAVTVFTRNEDPVVGWAFAQVNFIPSIMDCIKLQKYTED